jgi:hypothetical protein
LAWTTALLLGDCKYYVHGHFVFDSGGDGTHDTFLQPWREIENDHDLLL